MFSAPRLWAVVRAAAGIPRPSLRERMGPGSPAGVKRGKQSLELGSHPEKLTAELGSQNPYGITAFHAPADVPSIRRSWAAQTHGGAPGLRELGGGNSNHREGFAPRIQSVESRVHGMLALAGPPSGSSKLPGGVGSRDEVPWAGICSRAAVALWRGF